MAALEQRNYENALPNEPPEEMIPYLRSKGRFSGHVLIFKMGHVWNPLTETRDPMVRVICSACGKTFYTDQMPLDLDANQACSKAVRYAFWNWQTKKAVGNGEETVCPQCGAAVKAYHSSHIGRKTQLDRAWCLTVTRVEDRLALVGWYVEQVVNIDGIEKIWTDRWEAYVVEEKKVIKLTGFMRYMNTILWHDKWKQLKRCVDTWRKAESPSEFILPWDPAILIGSTAENSKLDRYLALGPDTYPVSYLRVWARHPNAENLIVQGAGNILNECLKADIEYAGYVYPYSRRTGVPKLEEINWKERRPAQMLHLTKEEYRVAISAGWSRYDWNFFCDAKEQGLSMKFPQDMQDCIQAGTMWAGRMLHDPKDSAILLRSVRYLRKQRERYGNQWDHMDGQFLSDYWSMAKANGADVSDPYVRFPKCLGYAHDRMLQERRRREDTMRQEEAEKEQERREREMEKYRVQFTELLPRLTPYTFSADGILCRPCMSPEELDTEGSVLHHCVSLYKDKHANGKQPIFFVRRESEPDKPWFTLQFSLSTLTVIQNRGNHNCARTEEVAAFEKKFLEHARSVAHSGSTHARVGVR